MPIIGDPILIGGGGGGISDNDAVLVVVAKTGATITVTKGSVSLTPTMWTWNSDSNYDCALFVIPSNMFDAINAWTVSATLSGNVNSKTIIIDSAKEYEVRIGYEYIILSSTDTSGISRLTRTATGSYRSFELDSNNRWGCANQSNTSVGGFLSYISLDLTSFSRMSLTYTSMNACSYHSGQFGIYVMTGAHIPTIVAGTGYNVYTGSPTEYLATDRFVDDTASGTRAGTFVIDLTSFSGIYYVGFSHGRGSVGAGARPWGGYVTDWRLE